MHQLLKLLFVILAVVFASAYPRPTGEDGLDGAVRAQRQAGGDHHDAVDFGAHTGDHGAFGWHADFPVHTH